MKCQALAITGQGLALRYGNPPNGEGQYATGKN